MYCNVCVQVIPEVSSTNIMDMAERMKEKDAKLHDANVSMANHFELLFKMFLDLIRVSLNRDGFSCKAISNPCVLLPHRYMKLCKP